MNIFGKWDIQKQKVFENTGMYPTLTTYLLENYWKSESIAVIMFRN